MSLMDNVILLVAGAICTLFTGLILGLVRKADSMVTALNKMQESLAVWTDVVKGTTETVKDHETRIAHVEGLTNYWKGRGTFSTRRTDSSSIGE